MEPVEAVEAVEAIGQSKQAKRSAHSRSSNQSPRNEIIITAATPLKNELANDDKLPCGSQGTQLEDLPFDICCEIVRHLDVESALSLLSTNRYLHGNLSSKFLFLISRLDKKKFLQHADAFAKYRHMKMWACFECLLMLPRSSFGGRVFHQDTKNASRECLDCRNKRWRIAQQLDYLDVIELRSTCHLMRLNVSSDWVPLHKRFLVVRKYEPIVLHDGTLSPARCPCYGCFQAKKLKSFTSKQIELSVESPDKFWKRRCQRCLLRINAQPDLNTTPAGFCGQVLDQMKTWRAGYAKALESLEAEESATTFDKQTESLLEKRRRVLWEAVNDDIVQRMSLHMV
ncbi:hypothetical protein CKAH01_18309 [Colletotrichum kahawae]|uniref:F-box domain-containing protein n=1 Tax=Colletotrichum kahawae TaxID=34407 RepID=A0AAD9YAB1_COLKA|nr:hypothetical protein CKAH01_18309 [Colletotrichum kahawae]